MEMDFQVFGEIIKNRKIPLLPLLLITIIIIIVIIVILLLITNIWFKIEKYCYMWS